MYLSKYGVARTVQIPVRKAASQDYARGADWTPVAGDVQISLDGGAFADVTNPPTALDSTNGAVWAFALTAGELTAAQIVVVVSDTPAKAVEDAVFDIETYGHASAQHAFDLDTPTVNPGTGGIVTASFAAGAIDAAALATDALGALELSAGAVTEIVDAVWAKTMTELSAVPGVTGTVLQALEWVFLINRNKIIQTASTETIKKDNSVTTLATSATSDDGTTFVRDKYS